MAEHDVLDVDDRAPIDVLDLTVTEIGQGAAAFGVNEESGGCACASCGGCCTFECR